jgi:hypothetical protein
MPLGNKNNILVGAAGIFIGPTGNVRPATSTRAAFLAGATGTTAGTGSAITDWRNVGFTQDGLEVTNSPSFGEVEVDQLLDTPLMFKDGMTQSISTTFAEATLENLLVAWGQAASTLTSTASDKTMVIDGGALGSAPVERGLIAIGNAPRINATTYGERLIHAFRVLSVEDSAITFSRSDPSTVPVTFRAMPDDNGQYGIIRDTLV